MKMKTKIKKYTALLLAVLMVVAMIPMSAAAAGTITVTAPGAGNGGDVSVDSSTPDDGDTVTITVTADADSALKSLAVKDENTAAISVVDKNNGTYTFAYNEAAMGDVTVDAVFAKKITHNSGTNGTVGRKSNQEQQRRNSEGESQARHLRGRLLIKVITRKTSISETVLKSVPFGKKKRIKPFTFSLAPRCHGLCVSAK